MVYCMERIIKCIPLLCLCLCPPK